MIAIYKEENQNYEYNGDFIINPTKCELEFEINGVCEVELEHLYTKDNRWKCIEEDSVVALPTPWSEKQLFRIYEVSLGMTSVKAYARHIFFDLIHEILLDCRPTNANGQEAINKILSGTKYTGHSDIRLIDTVHLIRKNIVEALTSNDENSFFTRWGGERFYDNFDVYINNRIGKDSNITIDYGKNLKQIEKIINIDNVVTRIIPVGFDGLMLEGITPWVDSVNINKYSTIRSKEIKFEDVKVNNETVKDGFNTIEEARQELIKRAKELFDNGIDQPQVNYKVDIIDITNVNEYKPFKRLETINLGDRIKIRYKKIDIDIDARCIKYKYDCILKRFITLEFGNFENDYLNNQADITNKTDNILNADGTIKTDKLYGIMDAARVQMKAMVDIAEKQHVRAIFFEDRNKESPTYGAMALGTMGFEIASTIDPSTNEWKFTTCGTGKGFIADHIIGGTLMGIILKSLNGDLEISLDNNEDGMVFFDGKKPNGDKKKTLQMNNASLTFWDQVYGEVIAGRIASVILDNSSVKGISMNHTDESYMSLSYSNKNNINEYTAYMLLDIYGKHPNSTKPVTIFQDADMTNGKKLYFGNGYIFKASSGRMAQICPTGWTVSKNETTPLLEIPYDCSAIIANIPFVQQRALATYGLSRTAVVETQEPTIAYTGEVIIDSTGVAIVPLSSVFIEQMGTNKKYHVFTSIYNGKILKITRNETAFIIEADPGTDLSYEIKAVNGG